MTTTGTTTIMLQILKEMQEQRLADKNRLDEQRRLDQERQQDQRRADQEKLQKFEEQCIADEERCRSASHQTDAGGGDYFDRPFFISKGGL